MIILTIVYDTCNGISSDCFACETLDSAIEQAKKLQIKFCDDFDVDTSCYHNCWIDDSYDVYKEITIDMNNKEDHLVCETKCESERMYIRFKEITDLV